MRDQICIDDAIEEVGVDGVVQVGVGVAVEPAGAVAEGVVESEGLPEDFEGGEEEEEDAVAGLEVTW